MKKITESGFTLVEMLVAMAILVVVTSLAVPSMTELIESNRTNSITQSLYASLVSARSEAVSRNQNVVICKSSNGIFCTTANAWEQGWLIFVDEDADGVKDITDPVTISVSSLDNDFTLRTGTAYSNKLQFRPDGTVTEADTFRLCSASNIPEDGRSVILNITGRPRSTESSGVCP